MIEIRVDKRSREVLLRFPGLTDEIRNNLRKSLYDIGEEVKRENKRLIKSKDKTGRIYKFKGRDHQASAPGEAPANRSGRLMKSSNYRVRNHQEMSIGEEVLWAKFLEEGTRKMSPRPHLIRAINNTAGVTYNILEEAGKIS